MVRPAAMVPLHRKSSVGCAVVETAHGSTASRTIASGNTRRRIMPPGPRDAGVVFDGESREKVGTRGLAARPGRRIRRVPDPGCPFPDAGEGRTAVAVGD